jgi:hypothetical protein
MKSDIVLRLTQPPVFAEPADSQRLRLVAQEAAATITRLTVERDLLRGALDIEGIRKLEDDVQYYSGNESAGRHAILLRKADAWDKAIKALEGPQQSA